jgi:hypothetical protein
MAVEAEAVPNPDNQREAQPGAQRSERASAPGTADSQGDGPPSAANPETRVPNPVSSPNPESQTPSASSAADSRRDGPSSSANPETQIPNPVSSADPDPNAPKKPKRKYTMSPRALEARRNSLKKARAVPKEVLYRSTPKRKESCRAKLVAAREAKRRRHEEGKSTGISHGLTCADLRGSLAAAGATPEELKAHRQQFRDELGPQTPKETKLVRGMADCAWRREQADHVQAVEDIITMQARLIVAAEPSQVGLKDFAVAKLALNLFNKGLDLEERHKKLNGRFGHLAYLFLAGRGQAEGFLEGLGVKLRWNTSNFEMIEWSAEEMGNPFVTRRKVAQVMAPKTGEMKPASEFDWKGKAAREAARQEQIKQQALYTDAPRYRHDPYEHSAQSVGEMVEKGQTVVVVMDGGKTRVQLGEEVEGQGVRTAHLVEGTAAVVAGIGAEEWPEWREAEVAAALRKKYLETSVALRGKNNVGGVTKEDLVKSFLEAFKAAGTRGSGQGTREEEGAEESSSSPGPEYRVPSTDPSAKPEPGIPNPVPPPDAGDQERIRAVAEAAWERAKVCEKRSQQERKKLAEILVQVGLSLREKLEQIMGLFTGVWDMFIAMCELAAELKQKVCAMLEARHPRTPEKPRDPKDFQGLWPSWLWSNPKMKKRFLEDMAILEGPEPVAVPRRKKKKENTDGEDSTG